MDYAAHYRRACELAEQAEQAAHDAGAHLASQYTKTAELLLRRAEVLGRLATARAQLAWVAYMGADIDAAALAERDPAPVLDLPPRLTPRNANSPGASTARAQSPTK